MKREPDEEVRPSRAARGADRRRRQLAVIVVAALVVVAVGVFAIFSSRDTGGGGTEGTGGGSNRPDPEATVAFQVKGTTAPMLAVIGRGTEPFVMPVPQDLTIVVPGRGETSATALAALTGPSIHTALSNMTGTWLGHHAVLTLNELADVVDRAGGVPVQLTVAYPTKSGSLGPGALTLTGAQTKAFLAGTTDDAGARWEIFLLAMLSAPPPMEPSDFAETDDGEAVADVFTQATGAQVVDVPADLIGDSLRVPNYQELDAVVGDLLDTPVPTPVIVQNGTGTPGVGEAVAASIIPAAFRVTLSQNAQNFDLETTDIFANGVAHEKAAIRAREAMGVGRVRVSQLSSGIGDITIVVGKDFTI